MAAVGRKLFSGSKKVRKGPVSSGGSTAHKSDGEITPESPGHHGARLSAGFTVSTSLRRSVPFLLLMPPK